MNIDIDHLRTWIGRTSTVDDQVTAVPLRALAATLDRDDLTAAAGNAIPPCWHWLYFLPVHRQSEIGPDGHPQRGGFLPPVPLPRRMWAGSQIQFNHPVTVGQAIARRSVVEDVRLKVGRSGPLVFVKVLHEVLAQGQVAIVERHDIVYRGAAQPGDAAPPPSPAPTDAAWTRRIVPDDVLLFRYSALTFNGHRIHYDRQYVTQVEGYPGLVVHGPLIATCLLELLHLHLPQACVARFEFRALQPIFDTAAFEVCGQWQGQAASGSGAQRAVRLWARTPAGHLAMDALATLA